MKRYIPTFVQRPGDTEQWYGMKEDDDGEWYERKEADARIAELELALKALIVAVQTCDGTAQIDLTDAKKALGL